MWRNSGSPAPRVVVGADGAAVPGTAVGPVVAGVGPDVGDERTVCAGFDAGVPVGAGGCNEGAIEGPTELDA